MNNKNNNDVEQIMETFQIAQEEEILLLRAFTTHIKQLNSNISEEEFEIYFQKALLLHDKLRDQHNLEFMVEIEEHATNILCSKVELIIHSYLRALGTEVLKILISEDLNFDKVLRWEKPLNRSGYGILNYESQIKFSNKVIKNVEHLSVQRMDPRSINVSIDSPDADIEQIIPYHQKSKEETFESLDSLINSLNNRLKSEKILELQDYFKSSLDINSVRNLFAIFALVDEEKARLLLNLGVEGIEYS